MEVKNPAAPCQLKIAESERITLPLPKSTRDNAVIRSTDVQKMLPPRMFDVSVNPFPKECEHIRLETGDDAIESKEFGFHLQKKRI